MAPYQAGSAYWKLYAYDVLHNCRRLDIGLFLQNGSGQMTGLNTAQVETTFSEFLADPVQQISWMLVVTIVGFLICSRGLKGGVEKVSKYMMGLLFLILIILVIHSFFLERRKGRAFLLSDS